MAVEDASQQGRGAKWLLVAQAVKFSTNLLGVLVLSRLLSPAEIGIVALGWAMVGVGEILRDFGLSASVVRSPQLTWFEKTNLFWLNSGLGLLLMLLAFFAAPFIAEAFGSPDLLLVIIGLSPVFILNGLSAQFRADLTRRMLFTRVALVDSIAPLAGLVAAVAGAWLGAGFWSVVIQYLVLSGASLLLLVLLAGWVPGLPNKQGDVRKHIQFGRRIAVSEILAYFGNNVDTLALGYFSTAGAVGQYNRGFQLAVSPLLQLRGPANTVIVPALARRTGDLEAFQALLLRGARVVGYTILPVAALMAASHTSIIEIALGPEWNAAAGIFGVLAVAAGLQQLSSVASWTFLTIGDGKQLQAYSFVALTVKAALICSCAWMGALAVAYAYLASVVVLWPVVLVWAFKSAKIPAKSIVLQSVRMMLAFGFASGLAHLVGLLIPNSPVCSLLVSMAGLVIAYGVLAIIPTYRRDIVLAWRDIRRILSRNGI